MKKSAGKKYEAGKKDPVKFIRDVGGKKTQYQ